MITERNQRSKEHQKLSLDFLTVADSRSCMAETNTILYSDYHPIKKKSNKKVK